MYYVYILSCSGNKPYTGCTDNLKERIERHNKGYVPATKNIYLSQKSDTDICGFILH
ncbi:MAG: excinuclease ABC C subunit domain-containing protein [Candidatus Amesbacteria bacterium GW2011_GWA2_47_70]|uniref:Excinuclease ABC C subunit domain-containing protein n=1 Tax=Candidatus Amesbacteria bacterium GW2011_GWC2_45_19 TaxID=1618366 RepID=A0A0G1M1U8_9BACT|nr:MAG: excinuclease ABC C subunit domain-containing protein [Candidatus Amesbacteria bacterium GW2011_GWC2_45_19]KKU79834.1 MAG: excinuclease ABC C subunit domain-containing protein [Candidatus Amesbacteria bacterium GW2011_GWA2_47_70]